MTVLRGNMRNAICFACAALALPLAARAQPSMPAPIPVAPPGFAAPSDCKIAVPPNLQAESAQALLLLKVEVDANGVMHNASLFRSSGYPDFDKAVLACAEGRHDRISSIDGRPTAVTAVAGYFLQRNGPSVLHVSQPDGTLPFCPTKYPPLEVRLGHQGDVTLSYRIGVDGSTKDIVLVTSSGYPTLDQASKDCVASWIFFPFTKDGQRVEVEQTTTTHWRLVR